MIERKFRDIRALLDEAESRALKGVGMKQKLPVTEARRIIRKIIIDLSEISKQIQIKE
jgi:hypothetical protein